MSAAADERLRQEREAFDINKAHSKAWFRLQLMIGYVFLAFLLLVGGLCIYALSNSDAFSAPVLICAAVGLLTDLVGLGALAMKVVLTPSKRPTLEPVCRITTSRSPKSLR